MSYETPDESTTPIEYLVNFESNMPALDASSDQLDRLAELFTEAKNQFIPTDSSTGKWRGFLEHASNICELETTKINPNTMTVVRALENYIEHHRNRPGLQSR